MIDTRPHRRTVLAGLVSAGVAPSLALASNEAPSQADPDAFATLGDKAAALEQLRAIVVVYQGRQRFARAVRGPDIDTPVNVKSVSKSIVALLTGIAIGEGIVPGTQASLGELVPDLVPPGADPRTSAITIADLLTMQAGLERTSGPNYGAFVSSDDWVRHALDRPFVAEPGERFQYSTGSYHVLGAVLAKLAGRSLLQLAREWLAEPMGITIPAWTRDPQGRYLGGNNMALSPRAMARIGEMVRLGGTHNDTRIVPADWIDTSLEPRTRSPFSGDAYGYGWFLATIGGLPAAYARGYGGQMIYVMREAELTVAVTSDPTRPARTDGHVGDIHRLLETEVLPSVTS